MRALVLAYSLRGQLSFSYDRAGSIAKRIRQRRRSCRRIRFADDRREVSSSGNSALIVRDRELTVSLQQSDALKTYNKERDIQVQKHSQSRDPQNRSSAGTYSTAQSLRKLVRFEESSSARDNFSRTTFLLVFLFVDFSRATVVSATVAAADSGCSRSTRSRSQRCCRIEEKKVQVISRVFCEFCFLCKLYCFS